MIKTMSIPATLELGNVEERSNTMEILTFSRLSGLRKVAVLFRSVLLQDEAAAHHLFDSLNSMEKVMVREELASMGVLGAEIVTDVLREFDVLCGVHKAYREGGVDGAISVGEKFLHKAQARRLAETLGSRKNGEAEVEVREEAVEVENADEAPAGVNAEVAEEFSEGPERESLDEGEPIAEPETALLAGMEEKDLEDVAS